MAPLVVVKFASLGNVDNCLCDQVAMPFEVSFSFVFFGFENQNLELIVMAHPTIGHLVFFWACWQIAMPKWCQSTQLHFQAGKMGPTSDG